MVDQAEALRQLAMHLGACRSARDQGRVIVVIGAQPGVGATTTSVNLSIALTRHESSVMLVDADFDGPDAHRQCGLASRYTLKHLLEGNRTVREIQQVGPAGMTLLPGCQINVDHPPEGMEPFADRLPSFADWVIIDTGRGLPFPELYRKADDVIVVTTTAPDSVMEAYAVVKQTAGMLTAARFWLVVSQATDLSRAEDTQNRIAMSCDRFLNLPVHAAANIPVDICVQQADEINRPVLLHSPTSPMSLAMEMLATELARTGGKISSALALVAPTERTL